MGRLRNAAFIRLLVDLLGLAVLQLSTGLMGTFQLGDEVSIGEVAGVLATVAGILLLGLFLIVASIAAWVISILGWGNICRAKWRKFYCVTRVVVILAPILATLTVAAMIISAFLELFATGLRGEFTGSDVFTSGFLKAFVAGMVIAAAGRVFEGVATFDLGLLTQVYLLAAAAVVYIASTAINVASISVTWLSVVSLILSILANLLFGIGYHYARKRLMSQIWQPIPSPVQPTQGG